QVRGSLAFADESTVFHLAPPVKHDEGGEREGEARRERAALVEIVPDGPEDARLVLAHRVQGDVEHGVLEERVLEALEDGPCERLYLCGRKLQGGYDLVSNAALDEDREERVFH